MNWSEMEKNKTEILAMQPGEELDNVVAEKVFGWTVANQYEDEVIFADGNGSLYALESYEFSRGEWAAMQVVETLRHNECCVHLSALPGGFECTVFHTESGRSDRICGNTMPEVICKAALIFVSWPEWNGGKWRWTWDNYRK